MNTGEDILNMFIDEKKLLSAANAEYIKHFGALSDYAKNFDNFDTFAFDKSKITDYKTSKSELILHVDSHIMRYTFIINEYYDKIHFNVLHKMPSDYPDYKKFNFFYLNRNKIDNNIISAKSFKKYINNTAHECIDIIEHINSEWYLKYEMFLSDDFIDELNKILYINLYAKNIIDVSDCLEILNNSGTNIKIKGPSFNDIKDELLEQIYKKEAAKNYVIDTANKYLNNVPLKKGVFKSINKKPFDYNEFDKFKSKISADGDFIPKHIYNSALNFITDRYIKELNDNTTAYNDNFQYPPVYPNPFFNTSPTNKLFIDNAENFLNNTFNTAYKKAASKLTEMLKYVDKYYTYQQDIINIIKDTEANKYYKLVQVSRFDPVATLYIIPLHPLEELYKGMAAYLPSKIIIGEYSNPAGTPFTTPTGTPAPTRPTSPTPAGPASPTPAGPATTTPYVAISRQAPALKKTMREFIDIYLNDKNKIKSAIDEFTASGEDVSKMTTPEYIDIMNKFIDLNNNVLKPANIEHTRDKSFKFDAEETLLYYWVSYLTKFKSPFPISNFDTSLIPDFVNIIDTSTTTPATGSGRTVIKLNYINYLPIPVNKKMRGGVKIKVPLRTIINHDI
jgi:hypothetical protein